MRLLALYDDEKRPEEVEGILAEAKSALPSDANLDVIEGMILHRREDYTKAEEAYQRALEKDPKNTTALFNLGVLLDKNGDFDAAIAQMRKTLETDPDYAEAYNYIGYSFAEKGIKLEEAKKLLEKALTLEPENPYYLDSYAWALYRKGEYASASKQMDLCLEKLKTARKDDAVIYDHAAEIQKKLKVLDRAADYWRKALELDPAREEFRKKLEGIRP